MKWAALITILCLTGQGAYSSVTEESEKAAVLYFLENTNTVTGLVRDKSPSFPNEVIGNRSEPDFYPVASSAATGFGLTVIANASLNNLIDPLTAKAYFNRAMTFLNSEQVPKNHGFFLHWMDWRTGKSVWDQFNDYSSIDTALLIAGALYAAQIFPDEPGAFIAHKLYDEMDFDWIRTDGGLLPQSKSLNLCYYPGKGFSPYRWTEPAEQMILVLLGLGSRTHPLPLSSWRQWKRHTEATDAGILFGSRMPLFVHQYSQLFIDFRNVKDGYQNYYANARTAAQFNRKQALAGSESLTFREGFWGFSAGQVLASGNAEHRDYLVGTPSHHDGTVCIGCVAGSAAFAPQTVLKDLSEWRQGKYAAQIWGRYGFTDSLNLDQNWISQDTIGITVGAAYMGLINLKKGTSVWSEFNNIPEIRNALQKIAVKRPY